MSSLRLQVTLRRLDGSGVKKLRTSYRLRSMPSFGSLLRAMRLRGMTGQQQTTSSTAREDPRR